MMTLAVLGATVGAVLRLPLPWWLGIPLLVYWVVVAVLLIMDDREPSRTLTWLFVLLLFPILGLVFFLFFGRDWKIITARRHSTEDFMASVVAKMEPIYERNAAAADRFRREYAIPPPAASPPRSRRRTASGSCRRRRSRSTRQAR